MPSTDAATRAVPVALIMTGMVAVLMNWSARRQVRTAYSPYLTTCGRESATISVVEGMAVGIETSTISLRVASKRPFFPDHSCGIPHPT